MNICKLSDCVNDTDFLTLEPFETVPMANIIFYKEFNPGSDGGVNWVIYAFKLSSMYNYLTQPDVLHEVFLLIQKVYHVIPKVSVHQFDFYKIF